MSSSKEGGATTPAHQRKYKGVRRRKWGKWVSEIRVRGTRDRLWLGSYSTPEAAAVAHDVATYCMRGPSSLERLNFPLTMPNSVVLQTGPMSTGSVQKAASDAGMAVDAKFVANECSRSDSHEEERVNGNDAFHGVDMTSECQIREEDRFWINGGIRSGQGEGSIDISVEDYL